MKYSTPDQTKDLIIFVIIIIIIFMVGCSPHKGVKDISYLELAGMRNIVELSREPIICAPDFKERLYFSAVTVQGHKVTGVMCSESRERKATVKLKPAKTEEKI